jgi:hypothetical protein
MKAEDVNLVQRNGFCITTTRSTVAVIGCLTHRKIEIRRWGVLVLSNTEDRG